MNEQTTMGVLMCLQGLMAAKFDVESCVRQMREAHARGETLSTKQLRAIARRSQNAITTIPGTG